MVVSAARSEMGSAAEKLATQLRRQLSYRKCANGVGSFSRKEQD